MALVSVIRRWHLRGGMPIRESRHRKQRRNVKRLYKELVGLGDRAGLPIDWPSTALSWLKKVREIRL